MHISYDVVITTNYLFLSPFPFVYFWKCFTKVFYNFFLTFSLNPFPPPLLNTWETKIFFFMDSKIWYNFLVNPVFFIGPIILTKGKIWYNVQLSKLFFLQNDCNLGHSIQEFGINHLARKAFKTLDALIQYNNYFYLSTG